MVRLAALLLLAGAPLVAQQQDPVLANALQAHRDGDLDAAVTGYRDYLTRHPDNFEIRSNLGAVLSHQGRFEEAIVEYKAALKQAPSNPGIVTNLALAYYKSRDVVAAARELSSIRPLVPNSQQVTMLLADCWLQMGEYGKVIDLLGPKAKSNPNDLAVAYLLGTALVRAKRVDEGQRVLNQIFEKGDSAEGRLLLGSAKMNQADFAGALQDLTKAVELNGKLPSVNATHGQALMATGDTAGAAVAFRKELALNPAHFEANLNLAVILKQDQEYAEALTLLDRALKIRPGDLGVRYQVGTIYLAENRIEDALRELEACVKEAPNFTEAHVSLATVYYRLKRKADGDRERAIVQKLNDEAQANQPKGEVIRK